MKILITGATGFLGAKLSTYLRMLNKYDVYLAARDFKSLGHQVSEDKKRVLVLDQENTMTEAVKGMDVIIHLAAMGYQDCEKDPKLAHIVNVDAVKILVQKSIQAKVKHFIYLSTFHIYGSNAKGIITELTEPKPMNVYAETHLLAEKELLKSSNSIKKNVIRLSNSFGMPLTENSAGWALVINDFCRQAIQNRKIVIQSSGHQLKDFLSSENLFSCIDFLVNQPQQVIQNKVFNLGSGRTLSLLQMADLIKNICAEKFKINIDVAVHGKEPSKESQTDFIYLSKELEKIGYHSTESIEQGLYYTLDSLLKTQSK